jgi:hypothetical protein
MNPRIITLSLASLKAGILFAILLCSILVAQSSWITVDPLIGTAVTIDLIFSIPFIYFLFIRNTSIPKTTVVPVFGLGVFAASLLLPTGERQLLELALLYAVPTVELAVLGYLGYRVYRTRAAFIAEAGRGRDVMERLRSAFEREIQPAVVARIAAFELSLFYYSFFRWRQRPDPLSFTYHRKDGPITLMTVFLFLMSAETVVVHVLLSQWSAVLAWILTASSIYFGLQIFAHLKAMLVRPVQITETELLIRCGAMGDTAIDLDSIESIRLGSEVLEAEGELATLTALGGLSKPNVLIELNDAARLNGYYGFSKVFRKIAFSIDEPAEFAGQVRQRIRDQ